MAIEDRGSIHRALLLGMALFVVFVVAGGGVWLLGMALGLPRITAFLVGMCGGPLLVAGIALGMIFALPLERRQQLLGVRPGGARPTDEQAPAERPDA